MTRLRSLILCWVLISMAAAAETQRHRMSLASQGLPLSVEVPVCAVASRVLLHDVILACDVSKGERAFSIQIGLAENKVGKKEIESDVDFVHFTREEPAFLEWEQREYSGTAKDFQRTFQTRRGTRYACFPQFDTKDARLLAEMESACRSIRER